MKKIPQILDLVSGRAHYIVRDIAGRGHDEFTVAILTREEITAVMDIIDRAAMRHEKSRVRKRIAELERELASLKREGR
ncbi:MAG: hypothetical protein LCH38_14685 [Proteobacteria bacterium]|nr:hypothetical protein [Pseudomonadota bacterium]